MNEILRKVLSYCLIGMPFVMFYIVLSLLDGWLRPLITFGVFALTFGCYYIGDKLLNTTYIK